MYINKLMEGMEKSTNTTVNGNKYIWELFKGLGLNKRIDEEVFMTYSLSECWKYVDEYIFQKVWQYEYKIRKYIIKTTQYG